MKSFYTALETKFPLLISNDTQVEAKKCQITVACLICLARDWWANEVLASIGSSKYKSFMTYDKL